MRKIDNKKIIIGDSEWLSSTKKKRFSENLRQLLSISDQEKAWFQKKSDELKKVFEFPVNHEFVQVGKAIQRMEKRFSETMQKTFLRISEERKQELIKVYALWGTYGWTMSPFANEKSVFECKVVDKKTADSIAVKQYTEQKMKEIFEDTRNCKRLKKMDFEEAVFDYKSKQYKSCALVLFSLIDAILIRLQKRSDLGERGRKVGLKAVNEVKKRTETDVDTRVFLTAIRCKSVFACLERMFESGKDFKKQPDVINRNFLDHGMMTRKVSRKDCIQLFLLYYNILKLLDEIY